MGLSRHLSRDVISKTGNEGFEARQFRQDRELVGRRRRDSSINLPSLKERYLKFHINLHINNSWFVLQRFIC